MLLLLARLVVGVGGGVEGETSSLLLLLARLEVAAAAEELLSLLGAVAGATGLAEVSVSG